MSQPESPERISGRRPFAPWNRTPLWVGAGALGLILISSFSTNDNVFLSALVTAGVVLVYFLVQCVARLVERSWKGAWFAFLRFSSGAVLLFVALCVYTMLTLFGPSEDGFADQLTIPDNIEIALPEEDESQTATEGSSAGTDEMQLAVRAALAQPGGDITEFTPSIPSLRRASTDHAKIFRDYLEASPDWHVFMEQGNRFAARRWSYGGVPKDTLHGYISEFADDSGFQTRCLICLDRKQWSRYLVQHVGEDSQPVKPQMTTGNGLQESRVMIECGGAWVEIFEESGKPERRVTKATLSVLEKEFAEFEKDPQAALAAARGRSRELALLEAGNDSPPFRLLNGMQPGIYDAVYALNPGEPGSVYLKAFEVTKGTALSVDRLEDAAKIRMAWSADPVEKFSGRSGFTIYEGDWGKPYAARFEVWFKPDSGKAARKLAERVFKIEGWQR